MGHAVFLADKNGIPDYILTADYDQTVIGRTKRDYVWIMARKPAISDADYERILQFIEKRGYDISKVQKVPQLPGKP